MRPSQPHLRHPHLCHFLSYWTGQHTLSKDDHSLCTSYTPDALPSSGSSSCGMSGKQHLYASSSYVVDHQLQQIVFGEEQGSWAMSGSGLR